METKVDIWHQINKNVIFWEFYNIVRNLRYCPFCPPCMKMPWRAWKRFGSDMEKFKILLTDPRILPFYARKFIIANHKNNIWLYFLKIKLSFLICYKGLCMKYIHIFLPTSSPLPFCLTSTYNPAHILHAEPLIIEFIVVMFFVISCKFVVVPIQGRLFTGINILNIEYV